MKKKVVIKSSSLPARPPAGFALLWWLFLQHIDAPGWAYGILWTLVVILTVNFIHYLATATERDVPGFGER